MRVLVTGATGFIGGHLARALASRKGGEYEVRALVRDPSRAGELAALGIEVVPGDLRDRSAIDRAVAGVETVFSIAAYFRHAGRASDFRAVNVEAVANLVEAAGRAGARRVVHTSTVGVHGHLDGVRLPATEDAPLSAVDHYTRSKIEGEAIARETASRTGIELVIVRTTGVHGPRDRRLLKLFRSVARRYPSIGSGKGFYHVTYIDDLVEGFRLCGVVPRAAGRTYIIAGGEARTRRELIRIIAEEAGVRPPRLRLPVWPFWLIGAACEAICIPLGITPPLSRMRARFFSKSQAFDISRAREELGYAPAVDLREGIRRTLAWYREAGWL